LLRTPGIKQKVIAIADALLAQESLNADEIVELLGLAAPAPAWVR
jgi:hypothetical protein